MDAELQRKLGALKIDHAEAREPRGRGLFLGIAVVVVVLAAIAFFLLRPRAELVRTAVAEESAAADGGSGQAAVLNASGYVTARRQATVSSKITGKVVEVLVEEGLKVETGQVLARLDDSQQRLALGLAEASLAAATKSVAENEARLREALLRKKRIGDLVGQGVVSTSEKDAVDAEVDALQARIAVQREQVTIAERELGIARQNLDDTIIRAPFAGVAISKNAQPGEIISPMSAGGGFTRTGISTIVDMASLEIEVDVNEAYIQRVQPGQKVQATLDAYPEWRIPAHVITTIPAADRQKATVTVRIGFDALDPRVLPDMGIKVAFLAEPVATTGGSGAAAPAPTRIVRVPRSALRGAKDDEFVLVVGGDGTLERRAVKLGVGSGEIAEVVAGLRSGERVVVDGRAELKAGDLVEEREN